MDLVSENLPILLHMYIFPVKTYYCIMLAGFIGTLFSCKDCQKNETSYSKIELILINDTAKISSIHFRGTDKTTIHTSPGNPQISINPYDSICYYDILIAGDTRYLGIKYKKEMVFDCNSYFYEYKIESLMHNFQSAVYVNKNYSTSVITMER